MDQNQQPTAPFPNVEDPPAEPDGNDSENVDTFSDNLGNEEAEPTERPVEFPKYKPRTADHNITVRRAAKIFESKGHPITERTIINWCSPTKTSPAKLDCAWDEPQAKYFITQQSIEQVMADMPTYPSESLPKIPKDGRSDSENPSDFPNEKDISSEPIPPDSEDDSTNSEELSETSPSLQSIKALSKDQLETQLFESRLASRMKDTWYEKQEAGHEAALLRKDEDHQRNLGQVIEQVKEFVNDLGETKRLVGKLEERLLQIEGPKENPEAGKESG